MKMRTAVSPLLGKQFPSFHNNLGTEIKQTKQVKRIPFKADVLIVKNTKYCFLSDNQALSVYFYMSH